MVKLTKSCSASVRARTWRGSALRQSRPLGAPKAWEGRGGICGQQLLPQRLLRKQQQLSDPEEGSLPEEAQVGTEFLALGGPGTAQRPLH